MAEGQTNTQQTQAAGQSAADTGVQQGSQATGSGQAQDMVTWSFPTHNMEKLPYGNDSYRALGDLNRYNQYQQGGWTTFVDQMQSLGYNPDDIVNVMAGVQANDGGGQSGVQQVQQQAAQQGVQQSQQSFQLPFKNQDEFDAYMGRRINDGIRKFKQQTDSEQAQRTQQQAIAESLSALGFKPKDNSKWNFEGRQYDGDQSYELVYQASLLAAVQKVVEHDLAASGLRQGTREWDNAVWQPATRQQIQRAAKMVEPLLKTLATASQGAPGNGSASQMPPATLGEGAGGRSQKNFKDMTPEERDEFLMNARRAAKAQQGG